MWLRATRRSPNAIMPSNRSIACVICFSHCSAPASGAARSGSIPISCSSRWKRSSRRWHRPRPRSKSVPPLRSRRARNRVSDERQSLPAHLPRIEVVIAPEDTACPCCKRPMHVIGEETCGAARRHPGAAPGAGDASAQICVPRVRERGRAGAGAGAADQRRAADRGDGGPCAGEQICLAPAALSTSPDAQRARGS